MALYNFELISRKMRPKKDEASREEDAIMRSININEYERSFRELSQIQPQRWVGFEKRMLVSDNLTSREVLIPNLYDKPNTLMQGMVITRQKA